MGSTKDKKPFDTNYEFNDDGSPKSFKHPNPRSGKDEYFNLESPGLVGSITDYARVGDYNKPGLDEARERAQKDARKKYNWGKGEK